VPTITLGIVAGLAIGLVIAWIVFLIGKARWSAVIRHDAVKRSLAVTSGKVHEQLVPYLPDFPYNPKDARFLGSPVDLIVFDGLAAVDVKRVVFVEVKTGVAGLSAAEGQIRDVVAARAVGWNEIRVPPLRDGEGDRG